MEVGKENRGKERKGRPGKLMFPGRKSAETFFLAFLFGANLLFDTRGRCRLVSSLGQSRLWCQLSTGLGTFPRVTSRHFCFGLQLSRQDFEGMWRVYGCKKTGSGCHFTLAVHHSHYCLGNEKTLCLSDSLCLIFLTADTTPGFFKNHIQWCAGKCETTSCPKKGGSRLWFVALANSPGVNTPTMAWWQRFQHELGREAQ